jgi:ABC-type multidrug transport system ATPase subunit
LDPDNSRHHQPVGPNGSGKTTLMNLLTGLIRLTRGDIEVLGTERGLTKPPKVGTALNSIFFPVL